MKDCLAKSEEFSNVPKDADLFLFVTSKKIILAKQYQNSL
jgi:hypothetical protein